MTRPPRRPAFPRRRRDGARRGHGQTLVEFALILPLFLVLLLGIIEFGFLFNGQLSLNYATRDASLVAAEAGSNSIADCLVLQQVDRDLSPPTDDNRVLTVTIFSASQSGVPVPNVYTSYTRGGSTTCGSITVPYTLGTDNYPTNVRCSDLDRGTCNPAYTSAGNTGVDIIGVRIDYGYLYITPLGRVLQTIPGTGAPLWNGSGMTMTAANAMRMEPVL